MQEINHIIIDFQALDQIGQEPPSQRKMAFVYLSENLSPPRGGVLDLRDRSVGKACVLAQTASRTGIQIVTHRPVQFRSKQVKEFFLFLSLHYLRPFVLIAEAEESPHRPQHPLHTPGEGSSESRGSPRETSPVPI